MMKNKRAAGNCYATAFAMFRRNPHRSTGQVLLCHGIVTRTKPPHEVMGHAWLEECLAGVWYVRDGLFPQRLWPRDLYYKIGTVDQAVVKRYGWAEARTNSAKAEEGFIHCGPWDPTIAGAAHANG